MISNEVYLAVRRLEIRIQRALAGVWSGLAPSLFRGAGLLFEEIRPYVPGDDVGNIDWKVTARTGQPYVKRYAEERERSFWLVVDASASMEFGSGDRTKRDAAIEITAAFLLHAAHNRDRFGLVELSNREGRLWRSSKGRKHALRLLAELLNPPAPASAEVASDVLQRLRRSAHRRSLVVFVSDFLDESMAEAACGLRGRHQVLAVHVIDPWERSLPNAGLVRFGELQSSRTCLIDSGNARCRKEYEKHCRDREQRLRQRFSKHGIRWLPIVTHRSPALSLIENLSR